MLGAEALPSLDRISKVSLGMTESVAILVSNFWALFHFAVKGHPSARTSCQAIAYKVGSVRGTANKGASDDQGSRGVESACVPYDIALLGRVLERSNFGRRRAVQRDA